MLGQRRTSTPTLDLVLHSQCHHRPDSEVPEVAWVCNAAGDRVGHGLERGAHRREHGRPTHPAACRQSARPRAGHSHALICRVVSGLTEASTGSARSAAGTSGPRPPYEAARSRRANAGTTMELARRHASGRGRGRRDPPLGRRVRAAPRRATGRGVRPRHRAGPRGRIPRRGYRLGQSRRADDIAGVDRPEPRLCWTRHRSPRWEPEPLRFLGVRGVAALDGSADRHEDHAGRTARLRGKIAQRATCDRANGRTHRQLLAPPSTAGQIT